MDRASPASSLLCSGLPLSSACQVGFRKPIPANGHQVPIVATRSSSKRLTFLCKKPTGDPWIAPPRPAARRAPARHEHPAGLPDSRSRFQQTEIKSTCLVPVRATSSYVIQIGLPGRGVWRSYVKTTKWRSLDRASPASSLCSGSP